MDKRTLRKRRLESWLVCAGSTTLIFAIMGVSTAFTAVGTAAETPEVEVSVMALEPETEVIEEESVALAPTIEETEPETLVVVETEPETEPETSYISVEESTEEIEETVEAIETTEETEETTEIYWGEPVTVEPIPMHEETEPEPETELTSEERQMLAQLVHAEVGICSAKIKALVVDVVLNRVEDERFPDTIKEVIFQRKQFSVVRNGTYYDAAYQLTESDWEAVDQECFDRMNEGVVYFNDDSIGGCANGVSGFKVGRMWFAY